MKKILAVLFTLFIGLSSTYASHIPGGNITYQCTGNPNEYVITMTQFVSCPSTLGTTVNITASNTCGLANPAIQLAQLGVMEEVSQICDAQIANSACATPAGTIPGVRMYTYQATIILPAGCNSWTFDFDLCCRDASTNTNGAGGNSLYVQTVMNSITAPCDASPFVTAQPIPYVCAGQAQSYCPGAVDPDGDSLFYSLVNPYGANAVLITHPFPYTPQMPLQGLILDPLTGCITFNQPTIGNFVVTYLIEAFDANGNLTGSIIHDFQFEVINCTNVTPVPPAAGIVLTSGNALQTSPTTLELCEGSTACFSMVFSDPDPTDTLTIDTAISNIFTAFPGAVITVTGTNPVTIGICWTVPAGSPSQIVTTVTVTDNACPIEGTATQVAIFDVITSTVASADVTICGTQTAPLTASGGTIFNWAAITGPAINVGTNFSCNPCANPVAKPIATTTYEVTSNLSGGCKNIDTVTVTVVPDFTATATQSSTSSCLLDPVDLDVIVTPAVAGYTYLWDPATYLSATNIANPIANITAPGVYQYTVEVTDPNGCIKLDTIDITIIAAVSPVIDILTPDSLMACGDSILIDLDLGNGIPAVCGPSASNVCSMPTTQSVVGNGTTNINADPTPYDGGWEDGRVQMIYTAAELNALGFIGGKITEIAFNVDNAGNKSYTGLTISMMCTPLNDFATNTFVAGASQVYNVGAFPATYTPVIGWNTHTLNTAYDWDGFSNLLIEVCFDNSSWSQSATVTQTATPTNRVLYDFTDRASGCTLATPTGSVNRPDIRLTHCPTPPDPNDYSFLWTPNTTIITSVMQNPTVFPSSPTTYYVTVTDTAGGCFDTDSIVIDVVCGQCYPPNPTTTDITCKDGSDGKIILDPVFVLGSEVQNFQWKDSITGGILQVTNNITVGMKDSLVGLPAGTYIITMTDSAGCSSDTTVTLYEPDSVVINTITPDNIICIGGVTPISATAIGGNGAPYMYNWIDLSTVTPIAGNGPHNVSPIISPTCYSVYVLDPLGCTSDTQQVCMSLYPNLIASTSDDSITICPGLSTNIDITTVGGSGVGYNYDWYENNVLIGNGTVINVTPTSSPTSYIGVATDNCTTPSDSVTIYVDWFDLPTPDFTRNKPDSCYPITIEFTNTSTPTALIGSSMWSISDGSVLNGDPVNHNFLTPVCHDVTLTVTTIDGCIVDTTFFDYVCPHDYPNANFSMDPPITDVLNTIIEFTSLSTQLPLTYLWEFNSGISPDSSTAMHPTHTFPNDEPGTYPVVLTVTNLNGCQDTARGTVIVNGIYIFYAPNTFSPDGDGVNDIWAPVGEGIDFTQYTLQIFDRWGALLHTGPASLGWDGTYSGKQVQVGTYVWKVVAKEEYSPIIHDNYGHVNLIR